MNRETLLETNKQKIKKKIKKPNRWQQIDHVSKKNVPNTTREQVIARQSNDNDATGNGNDRLVTTRPTACKQTARGDSETAKVGTHAVQDPEEGRRRWGERVGGGSRANSARRPEAATPGELAPPTAKSEHVWRSRLEGPRPTFLRSQPVTGGASGNCYFGGRNMSSVGLRPCAMTGRWVRRLDDTPSRALAILGRPVFPDQDRRYFLAGFRPLSAGLSPSGGGNSSRTKQKTTTLPTATPHPPSWWTRHWPPPMKAIKVNYKPDGA